jgi:hypothetical protein
VTRTAAGCKRSKLPSRGIGAALAALVLSASAPAHGQHPLPPRVRPFHARIAEADAVAVVRVESVSTGRIEVALRDSLQGALPERFALKRAPGRAPPLEAGDHALVFLRGVRAPYVLVGDPDETLRLDDPAQAERWSATLREAFERRADPAGLASTYLHWMDEGPESLRELGFEGLSQPPVEVETVRGRVALDRARAAADPGRAPELRRLSAQLAVRTREGAAHLLTALPGDAPEPSVVALGLRGGAVYELDATRETLARCLAAGDAGARRAAIEALPTLATAFGPLALDEVRRLADSDPDSAVRRHAKRVLAVLVPSPTSTAPASP